MAGRLRDLARNETARVVAFLTMWKACFFAFVLFAIELFPKLFSQRMYWANFHFPTSAPPPSWIQLQTWDAQHYLYLAEYGYLPGDSSTAFFPLWPYAIKAFAFPLGNHYFIAALVLANVLSIVGLTMFHKYVLRAYLERDVADTALLLTLTYPGSLFFGFAYSEALFFLLAVAVVAALARGDWRTAVMVSFFLPLVRGVGIFIGAPMLYVVIRDWRARGAFDWRQALGLLVPLAGLGCYFAFMYIETGSPTAGMHAQNAFISNRSMLDLIDVWGLVQSFADVEWGHGYQTSVLDRLWFVVFVAALVYLWRKDKLLFFYALPLGLIPPMTSFMSYTRYLVVVFPVFVAGGLLLSGEPRRYARWLVVGLMTALQALLAIRYVNFYWAG
jgi:hypothetical protein